VPYISVIKTPKSGRISRRVETLSARLNISSQTSLSVESQEGLKHELSDHPRWDVFQILLSNLKKG